MVERGREEREEEQREKEKTRGGVGGDGRPTKGETKRKKEYRHGRGSLYSKYNVDSVNVRRHLYSMFNNIMSTTSVLKRRESTERSRGKEWKRAEEDM